MEQPIINFYNGNIQINNLPYLFTDNSIDVSDISYLNEDILFVEYGCKSLDVGYYGDNKLKVVIIEEEDWENPIYIKKISKNKISKSTVFQEINNAINYLMNNQ